MSESTTTSPSAELFRWETQPSAAALVHEVVDQAVSSSPATKRLAARMRDETGTRLVDWLEEIVVADEPEIRQRLATAGFVEGEDSQHGHPGGLFPQIRLEQASDGSALPSLAVKVDAVDDLTEAWSGQFELTTTGPAGGRFRCATLVDRDPQATQGPLKFVERHGAEGSGPAPATAQQIAKAAKHRASMSTRGRTGDEAAGFQLARALWDAAAADLDPGWATDLFFAAERTYWMSRNHAARVQYARQQQLGLGWANHDHHTYRSSRAHFQRLVAALEHMGFACRERFYAGREAGWGAQVLEHPAAGVVIFADVDLSPEEVAEDFAHHPLPPREDLGTVGMWCRLHGESFLAAGLHHLECQFDFDAAREQLAAAGVETMAPFTDFPHLKQAFTTGQMWPVDAGRLAAAVDDKHVTPETAEGFQRDGALGSHLEILERNDGYKGFNQTGISEIITRTDPRKW